MIKLAYIALTICDFVRLRVVSFQELCRALVSTGQDLSFVLTSTVKSNVLKILNSYPFSSSHKCMLVHHVISFSLLRENEHVHICIVIVDKHRSLTGIYVGCCSHRTKQIEMKGLKASEIV